MESGCHFKEEFPDRDDDNFLKTSVATFMPQEPNITYEEVDTRHLVPCKRDYVDAKKGRPSLTNLELSPILPL